MLDLAILGILKEQPLHGYELKKRLSGALGVLWGISYGSLYPALQRLEREGAIEIVEPTGELLAGVPTTGSLAGDLAAARAHVRRGKPTRRTRKAYRLTGLGERRFRELLLAEDPSDDERDFALKLAFCRHLEPTSRVELLEHRRRVLVAQLAQAHGSEPGRGDRYLRSLLEHRTQSTQRDLEWIDTLIAAEHRADQSGDPAVHISQSPVDRTSAASADVEIQGATAS